MLEIKSTHSGNQATIQVSGHADEAGAENLKAEFNKLPLDSIQDLVLDFNGLTHIGSAGLGKLLLFYKTIRSNDGQMKIINAGPEVYKLLADLELDKIFSISS